MVPIFMNIMHDKKTRLQHEAVQQLSSLTSSVWTNKLLCNVRVVVFKIQLHIAHKNITLILEPLETAPVFYELFDLISIIYANMQNLFLIL